MSRRHRDIDIPPRSSNSGPSETKRRKSTDSDDPLASTGSITCQNCSWVTIEENGSWFVLGCEPKCRVCANCFSQMVLCLAETSIMTCPCCAIIIHSWDTMRPQVHVRRSGPSIVMEDTNFELPVSSPRLDPIRFASENNSIVCHQNTPRDCASCGPCCRKCLLADSLSPHKVECSGECVKSETTFVSPCS
jgi:hypothetical protein